MPQKAIVTSVEAVDTFRANLVVYLSKARPTLDEVTAEVLRTRGWLESEQRTYWENQVRRRTQELEEAQQALFSAKLSNLREESAAEQIAFHRAKRAVEEAQGKLRVVKQWNREFDNRTQPLVKQMEKLQTLLTNDMVKACAYLSEVVKTLEAYAAIQPPGSGIGLTSGSAEPSAKGDFAGGPPTPPVSSGSLPNPGKPQGD